MNDAITESAVSEPATPVQEDIKPVPELMDRAQALLDKLEGQPVMIGFHASLKEALIATKSVNGVTMSSHKCVRQLTSITELTERVLSLTEDSTAAI